MKQLLLSFLFFLVCQFGFALNITSDSITDEYGNSIPRKVYSRIIITNPGTIEILYKIGAKNAITAIGKTSQSKIYPYEETEKLESIGNMRTPNFETILKLKPDLIILNSMASRNLENLKKMHFPVLVSDTQSLQDIIKSIQILGVITGHEKEAKELAENCQKKLTVIKENTYKRPKLKGAILFSISPMTAFGEDSLPADVLRHLNIENIAETVPGNRPILSPEYILKVNPDFLAGAMSLDNPKQILEASNVIPKTKAAKNQKIFILDSSVILRDSYRIFDEMDKLQEKIYK